MSKLKYAFSYLNLVTIRTFVSTSKILILHSKKNIKTQKMLIQLRDENMSIFPIKYGSCTNILSLSL